jgi:hypothetical protein
MEFVRCLVGWCVLSALGGAEVTQRQTVERKLV